LDPGKYFRNRLKRHHVYTDDLLLITRISQCRSQRRAFAAFMFSCALVFALLPMTGCTARQYRRQADKEVYRIIDQAEKQVRGTNTAFSIERPNAPEDPQKIAPEELISERNQTGERTIALDEALSLAVLNSRRYQTEKERLYLTALTLTGERYEFQPHPFASTAMDLDRLGDGDRLGTVRSRLGVNQFLKTGGSISLTLANDLLRYYTGDPRRSAVSIVSVNLAQPLLRGFGKNNPAVESLTQAERNVVYATRDYSYFQDSYAITIVSDYFNLLAQKDVVRNRYTNYFSRVQARQRVEARSVDREGSIAVGQARQAELSARNNYINSVATYLTSLDQFKLELGLPIGEKVHLDDQALVELQTHGMTPIQISTTAAYRFATDHQLQTLNAIDRFEDAKRKIKVAANRLLPDLNLFASASLESERPTDYTQFDPDQIRAGAGVELNLPIDRLRERNNFRATLISFDSELRNLTLSLDTLKDSIERGLRLLEQRRQTYEIQKGALDVANSRVTGATLLIEAGRSEMRDLIEAQDAQIAAQNAVTSALVNYQDALLRLMLDVGVLETETPKFWLKDHIAGTLPPAAGEDNPFLQRELVNPEEIF
jgi:outer membrane protein TolC